MVRQPKVDLLINHITLLKKLSYMLRLESKPSPGQL